MDKKTSHNGMVHTACMYASRGII